MQSELNRNNRIFNYIRHFFMDAFRCLSQCELSIALPWGFSESIFLTDSHEVSHFGKTSAQHIAKEIMDIELHLETSMFLNQVFSFETLFIQAPLGSQAPSSFMTNLEEEFFKFRPEYNEDFQLP